MNKKEQAALDAAVTAARLNRALRWSPETWIDRDVPVPDRDYTDGWNYNSYGEGRVERTWSGATSHGTYYENGSRGTGTQGGIKLYSNRVLALRAMRCEMELRFAKTLARIDAAIAEAKASE